MHVDGANVSAFTVVIDESDPKESFSAAALGLFGATVLNDIHPVVAAVEKQRVVAGRAGE